MIIDITEIINKIEDGIQIEFNIISYDKDKINIKHEEKFYTLRLCDCLYKQGINFVNTLEKYFAFSPLSNKNIQNVGIKCIGTVDKDYTILYQLFVQAI